MKELKIVLRRFQCLPTGPGTYEAYAVDEEFIKNKVRELRAWLAGNANANTNANARFPGLTIPSTARPTLLEAHVCATQEEAKRKLERSTRGGKRRRKCSAGEGDGEDDDEMDD